MPDFSPEELTEMEARRRQRVFLVKRQELYVVTAGEFLEGLRIQEMDETSVELVDPRTSAEAVLPLTKDEHGAL